MPELPEVETVARSVWPRIRGRKIHRVVRASELMFESEFGPAAHCLEGRRFAAVSRIGKFLFFRLSDRRTLLVHLGMTGRLGVVDAKEAVEPHTHLRLLLGPANGRPRELRFVDPRRFGELALLDSEGLRRRLHGRLGPDALTIRSTRLHEFFSKSRRAVKNLLLDQRVLAGVGNIYADEALFIARIHPRAVAASLEPERVVRLATAIRRVLRRSIANHGTTIRDYVTGEGVPGEFQARLRVYGRAGLACKVCKGVIAMDRSIASGRSTCFCPQCQRQ